MSYRALGRFKCDGCKVIESDGYDLPSEALQPILPAGWLRACTLSEGEGLAQHRTYHYCPNCKPLIASYLKGSAGEVRN